MLAKVSRKNQLTLPKKVVERLGFSPEEERYLDVEVQGNTVVMKPVIVTIEEKWAPEQASRFRKWALDHEGDVDFGSAQASTRFLKKRLKKK